MWKPRVEHRSDAIRKPLKSCLTAIAVPAGLLAALLLWGYGHARTHATASIYINDDAIRDSSKQQRPRGVMTVELYDNASRHLATARSTAAFDKLFLFHPDPEVGSCVQHDGHGHDARRCNAIHARWVSGWASDVRSASFVLNACELRAIPVKATHSSDAWWLWWIPLPHWFSPEVAENYEFNLHINTSSCTIVRD